MAIEDLPDLPPDVTSEDLRSAAVVLTEEDGDWERLAGWLAAVARTAPSRREDYARVYPTVFGDDETGISVPALHIHWGGRPPSEPDPYPAGRVAIPLGVLGFVVDACLDHAGPEVRNRAAARLIGLIGEPRTPAERYDALRRSEAFRAELRRADLVPPTVSITCSRGHAPGVIVDLPFNDPTIRSLAAHYRCEPMRDPARTYVIPPVPHGPAGA